MGSRSSKERKEDEKTSGAKAETNMPQDILQVLEAAGNGDKAALKKLAAAKRSQLEVKSKADGEEDLRPVHLAAWGGHLQVLEILISKGVDLEVIAQGRRAVHWAAVGGHVRAMKKLQGTGCDLTAVTGDGWNALHLAVDYGNLSATQWLVEEVGLSPDLKTAEGVTATRLAREAGHRPIYRYLKAKLADAAADGDVANLTRRLEKGESVDTPSCREGELGLLPIHLAAWGGHTETVKVLLDHGADPEAEVKGQRAVHWAAIGGHMKVLELLRQQGCDLKTLTADGSSALHLAADNGNIDATKWLLEDVGLELNLKNSKGCTARDLAQDNGHSTIVNFLLNKEDVSYKDYVTERLLGHGAFGAVYLVKKSGQQQVLKVVDLERLGPKGKQLAEKELNMMKSLQHSAIVACLGGEVTATKVYILAEYCSGGDLQQRIKSHKQREESISERQILKWCASLVSALKYLHGRSILHRDIKPNNILLTERNEVKLGDLGGAREVDEFSLPITRIGTQGYMSPEVINQEPYDSKADMWSLGCCLYELAALRRDDLLVEVSVPGNYSADYKDLVTKLLSKDPNKRPSAKAVLELALVCPFLTT